jgi:DNA-binding LytR/AlgR family response regulator
MMALSTGRAAKWWWSVQVGDLVKHKYGTMQGSGVILSIRPFDWKQARVLWTTHDQAEVYELETRYLEVINESR